MSIIDQADRELLKKYGTLKRKLTLAATMYLKPLKLGILQAGIIREITNQGNCNLAEIARVLDTDPAAIGRAIDTLIKKGYLIQGEHPSDRRQWVLSLTANGKILNRKIDKFFEMLANLMAKDLNSKEKKSAITAFEKMSESLQEFINENRKKRSL